MCMCILVQKLNTHYTTTYRPFIEANTREAACIFHLKKILSCPGKCHEIPPVIPTINAPEKTFKNAPIIPPVCAPVNTPVQPLELTGGCTGACIGGFTQDMLLGKKT